MNRLFHVPKISENVVSHYARDYEGVVELAEMQSKSSVVDADADTLE
jgi:hypothetical protein